MIKRGESLAVALLSLLFILVFVSACSVNKEIKQSTVQEGKQDIQQTEPKVKIIDENTDLRKFALDTKDLPDFNVISESRIEKDVQNQSAPVTYSINFERKPSENSNTAQRQSIVDQTSVYSSASSLKKEFSREIMLESIPKNYNEVNKDKIGDESYIFSGGLFGVGRVSIWFSKQDVLVKLSFAGIGADEAFSYAKTIESKIK